MAALEKAFGVSIRLLELEMAFLSYDMKYSIDVSTSACLSDLTKVASPGVGVVAVEGMFKVPLSCRIAQSRISKK